MELCLKNGKIFKFRDNFGPAKNTISVFGWRPKWQPMDRVHWTRKIRNIQKIQFQFFGWQPKWQPRRPKTDQGLSTDDLTTGHTITIRNPNFPENKRLVNLNFQFFYIILPGTVGCPFWLLLTMVGPSPCPSCNPDCSSLIRFDDVDGGVRGSW